MEDIDKILKKLREEMRKAIGASEEKIKKIRSEFAELIANIK